MKKMLMLGAHIFQVPIVKKAKKMGMYVGIVDINPQAPAFQYADESFVCSIKDYTGIMDIAKQFKPDGILTGACDVPVVTAASLCKELCLPGISEETALLATNKWEMLKAFERDEVSHPKFQLIRKSEIDNVVLQIPYPVISKPTDSSGSRGINYISSESELYNAVKASSEAGASGDVLVEEYMCGPEVSVEILVIDGAPHVLQITDKHTSGAPNFFETGHAQPSMLPTDIKQEIRDVASRACTALKIENSPVHAELKITDKGVKMVELGARMGSDGITSYLIDLSVSGIDMIEFAIKMAMGIPLDTISYKDSGIYSCIRFIMSEGGIIEKINGVDEARAIRGVCKIECTGVVGESYEKTNNNSTRLGYIVAQGKNTEEAAAICQMASDTIKVIMKK